MVAARAVARLAAATATPQTPPPAVDVTAADIKAFIDGLPADRISDQPIRIVDVGGDKVGVYGVFRPKSATQDAILHETSSSSGRIRKACSHCDSRLPGRQTYYGFRTGVRKR